jgi:hypothetical protein
MCFHDKGCVQCLPGYFLLQNYCQKCQKTLPGCDTCESATQCSNCFGDFLAVSPETSKCACVVTNQPHMSRNREGSCVCDSGYYLTQQGCKTCSELIPGCTKCFQTSVDTGIPIYTGANLATWTVRQYYVDCQQCDYGTYKIRTNAALGIKPSCPSCDSKFEGCVDCGSLGTYCNKCSNTHVFQKKYSSEPCKPCSYYWKGCVWCQGSSKCIKY